MIKIYKPLWTFISVSSILTLCIIGVLGRVFSFIIKKNVYSCQTFFQSLSIEIIPCHVEKVLLFSSTSIVIFLLLRMLATFCHVQKLKKHLSQKIVLSPTLQRLLQKHLLEQKVHIVKDRKPFAFCLGIKNPHIYISTATVSLMSRKELEAILLHEKYHLENRDSLVMAVASSVQILFPFFPILSDLLKQYRIEREIKADQNAIALLVDKKPLVSVLKKMLSAPSYSYATVASLADDTLEARVKILTTGVKHQRKFHLLNIVMSIISIFFLIAAIVTPVKASVLPASSPNAILVSVGGTSLNAVCSTHNASLSNTSSPIRASFDKNYSSK